MKYCYALFSVIFSPVHSSVDEELTTENTDSIINHDSQKRRNHIYEQPQIHMALPEESGGTQIAVMHVLYTVWLAKWHISECDIEH